MPQFDEIMFYDAYEDCLAPGDYDSPDGPIFGRLLQLWVEAGKPKMRGFIRAHAAAVANSLRDQLPGHRELERDLRQTHGLGLFAENS